MKPSREVDPRPATGIPDCFRRSMALPRRLVCGLRAGILALLREIGDENAYARHLAAHGTRHSGAEWRRFSDERFRAKYRRAKCC